MPTHKGQKSAYILVNLDVAGKLAAQLRFDLWDQLRAEVGWQCEGDIGLNLAKAVIAAK
jgi:hypothetical protein